MRPLPVPAEEGNLADLRPFINFASEDDFVLMAMWLIGALRETGPYPILFIHGEQGSGKSNVSRVLRSLVDPSAAAIRAKPKDLADLNISAENNWMLVFDNISGLPQWLSDGIAQLATGGGYAARKLYADRDEIFIEASRPIIINGIPDLATQADVASRAITAELPTIAEDKRRTESEFWSAFDEARPRILAGLLDAVSRAMRRLEGTKLDGMPRMADFAQWAVAAEDGETWKIGRFLSAYKANFEISANVAFESDSFATALRDWFFGEATSRHGDEWISPGRWEGEPARLLDAINSATPDATQKSRSWPKDAARLGSSRRRMAVGLRHIGIEFDMKKGGPKSRRLYIITDIRKP